MNPTANAHSAASALSAPETSARRAAPVTSNQLLQGRNEICIAHGDCVYTLRVTRQGKLILTK
ncbi:MAG TPA: hemin uptake protein HemP [Rhodocyclaceae bacterium]